jgi:hypothetical protein
MHVPCSYPRKIPMSQGNKGLERAAAGHKLAADPGVAVVDGLCKFIVPQRT